LLFTNRLITPIVEVLLLVALMVNNPRRMTWETRRSRWASIVLASVVTSRRASGAATSGSHLLDVQGHGWSPLLIKYLLGQAIDEIICLRQQLKERRP